MSTIDVVVAWLLGPRHLEHRDESGRPLGEVASAAYATTPHDEQVRTFGDARDASGLPCNLAALAQLRGHWDRILAWVGRIERGAPNTVGRMARRASFATRVAPLRALRVEPVTVEQAALFKAFLGFNELLMTLVLEERLALEDPPGPIEPWLDERPWLIGDAQVCAGTRAQIRRAWEALSADVEDDADADAADVEHAHVEDVDDDDDEPAESPSRSWLTDAWAASRELEALVASAAGAARVAFLRGAEPAQVGGRLLEASHVPRCVEALRNAPDAGAAHPALLFEAGRCPDSLRAFLADVAAERDADEAWVDAAAEPAQRLAGALGLVTSPISIAALEGCVQNS